MTSSRLFPLSCLGTSAVFIALSLTAPTVSVGEGPAKKPAVVARDAIKQPRVLECKSATKASTRKVANPKARESAQKGLNFLATKTAQWQEAHKCYGCHVQAVTLEAFAVGLHHQYEVKPESYLTVLKGLTTIAGGTRTGTGLRYAHGDTLEAPSKAFGGAALGRHDQWVDQSAREDLLVTAGQLLTYQQEDGSLLLGWTNPPVGVGSVQGAYQAIQTWQQAYARTADPRWRAAAQKSEGFLQATLDGWHKTPPAHIQDINYAILGLLSAGVGSSESSMVTLREMLLSLQNEDGGWGFGLKSAAKTVTPAVSNFTPGLHHMSASDASSPYASGQTLYTLRMMGLSDSDAAVQKGTEWLMAKQLESGGWSAAGFGKAEAMWGVLGLVSVDVLSLQVTGLERGMHVGGVHKLGVEAWDNSGAKVVKIELAVDDLDVHGACGDSMLHAWDTAGLEQGKHIVDVRAVNDRGEVSTRRFEVYSGDVYMTQLGSRFSDGGTMISLRNIAPKAMKNTVEVEIFSTTERDGAAVAKTSLREFSLEGKQGAMTLFWDGKTAEKKEARAGESYIARLRFKDARGKVRQTEELAFVHDTYEAQRERYAEVGGQLNFGDDAMAGVANTEVELVDEEGNVVQSTRSTASGNYRFKGVKKSKKKLRVRVKKKGFKDQEKALESLEDAPEASADFSL